MTKIYTPESLIPPGVDFRQGRTDGDDSADWDLSWAIQQFRVTDLALLDSSGNFNYEYIDSAGKLAMGVIPAARAKSFNLPGVRKYQTWAEWLAARPKVTSYYTFSFFGPTSTGPSLAPDAVFYPAEADSIVAELNRSLPAPSGVWSAVGLGQPDGNPTVTFHYVDDRMEFDIVAPSGQRFALGNNGLNSAYDGIYHSRHGSGFGRPGTWSQESLALPPVFHVSQITDDGTLPTTKRLPWPVVIPPGAIIVAGLMGGFHVQDADAALPAPSGDNAAVLAAIAHAEAVTVAGFTAVGVEAAKLVVK